MSPMKIKIGNKEFEITDDQISKANEANEAIDLGQDVVVRAKEEDESFKRNSYEDGRKAGVEIAVKEARETLGLDFQGKKMENLLDSYKNKILEDAKIEPEGKIKSVLEDNKKLKENLTTLTSELDLIKTDFVNYKQEGKINSALLSALPENIVLPKEDMLTLVKTKMQFEVSEDGRTIVKANGEVLKNPTTLDPLSEKDALTKFFSENPTYLKGAQGGAGGHDSPPNGGGKMTVEQFMEKKAKEGVSHTSDEFINELTSLQKEGLIEG